MTINPSDGFILVVGGAGFLGSYVSDILTERGYKVRIFDINPSAYLKPEQEMIVGDILNPELLMKAMEGCCAVYHFAGISDIEEARQKPIETCRYNVLGCANVLDAAHRCGVRRFIFASSLYVYSSQGHFYRASKQSAEMFIEAYHECYKLDYTILRYGSLYGRRADRRNGIYRLIYDAMTKREMVYGGTGEELREYIHVHDAAELSIDILKDEYANRHIILAGNEKMSVKAVMTMIAEMLGKDVSVRFSDNFLESHYFVTPYTFNPRMGKKLVSNKHVDIGQGLLDCIVEVHERINKER